MVMTMKQFWIILCCYSLFFLFSTFYSLKSIILNYIDNIRMVRLFRQNYQTFASSSNFLMSKFFSQIGFSSLTTSKQVIRFVFFLILFRQQEIQTVVSRCRKYVANKLLNMFENSDNTMYRKHVCMLLNFQYKRLFLS